MKKKMSQNRIKSRQVINKAKVITGFSYVTCIYSYISDV